MSNSADFKIVGKSVPVKDGVEKVTGRLKYAVDFSVPGMVYGKILRSPHAHAKIKRIDTNRAEALPGVLGLVTYEDAPDRDWLGVWYNYKGHIMDDTVRFVGDEVAAVAAVSEDVAAEALDLIEVEYEPLPAVFDPEEAMKPEAPLLRPEGNARDPSIISWGDVERGVEESDVVLESEMSFDSQQYAPIGPNACIAEWQGDRITLWSSTQTPSELRDAIAGGLGIPLSKVRVIAFPSGCSFGLWWSNNFHLITALLARKVRRPVKIVLTQEESFATVKRRHRERSKGRIGCKKDGDIVFIDVDHVFDNGGYGYKPDPGFLCCDLWGRSPHGRYKVQGVATNLVTAGCMRGVGDVTMGAFVERLVDLAAEELDMDPVEFRLRNHIRAGEPLRKGDKYWEGFPHFKKPPIVPLTSEGVGECLRKGAEAFGWKDRWAGWGRPSAVDGSKRRAVGAATSIHSSGVCLTGDVSAVVRVHSDGSATVCVSVGRHGQGSETTQAQVAAETLGVPLDRVEVEAGDTEACPWSHGSVASTAAHRSGFATWAAALDARSQILDIAAEHYLDSKPEELDIEEGIVFVRTDPKRRIAIADVLSQHRPETLAPPVIVGRPTCYMPADAFARNFGAHFVEVEVDTETGQVRLLDYVATQDSGTVLNPKVLANQVIGGAIMGSGFALMEGLVFDEAGRVLNPNFLDYKVLRAPDFPLSPRVIFSEPYDPLGPYGAKGGGEAPACAPIPAIAQAVYNAIGARLDVPMTPERVLRALGRI